MKKYFLSVCFLFLLLFTTHAELNPVDYELISLLNSISLDEEFDFEFLLTRQTDTIKILLNACFAKHGRPFHYRPTRVIFQNTHWYKVNPYYTNELLTETDKKNIQKLRALLQLSAAGQTLLYGLKRSPVYRREGTPGQEFEILMDKIREGFVIRGTIPPADLPGNIQSLERGPSGYEIDKLIFFDEYGPENWFIYNGVFYFFIDKSIDMGGIEYKQQSIYLSCVMDYRTKTISEISLLTVSTADF